MAFEDHNGPAEFEYHRQRMPYAMLRDGRRYWLYYDQIGSLKAVVDDADRIVKALHYDAFGTLLADSNPDFTVPLGYGGGLPDRHTGLVRFGFRDYDPDVGRWTAKDPIGYAGGDNDLYGYCLDDPINGVDPEGLFLEKLFQWGIKKAPKKLWDILDLNPMSNERIIKEIAQKEIDRLKEEGNTNSTKLEQLEELKKAWMKRECLRLRILPRKSFVKEISSRIQKKTKQTTGLW